MSKQFFTSPGIMETGQAEPPAEPTVEEAVLAVPELPLADPGEAARKRRLTGAEVLGNIRYLNQAYMTAARQAAAGDSRSWETAARYKKAIAAHWASVPKLERELRGMADAAREDEPETAAKLDSWLPGAPDRMLLQRENIRMDILGNPNTKAYYLGAGYGEANSEDMMAARSHRAPPGSVAFQRGSTLLALHDEHKGAVQKVESEMAVLDGIYAGTAQGITTASGVAGFNEQERKDAGYDDDTAGRAAFSIAAAFRDAGVADGGTSRRLTAAMSKAFAEREPVQTKRGDVVGTGAMRTTTLPKMVAFAEQMRAYAGKGLPVATVAEAVLTMPNSPALRTTAPGDLLTQALDSKDFRAQVQGAANLRAGLLASGQSVDKATAAYDAALMVAGWGAGMYDPKLAEPKYNEARATLASLQQSAVPGVFADGAQVKQTLEGSAQQAKQLTEQLKGAGFTAPVDPVATIQRMSQVEQIPNLAQQMKELELDAAVFGPDTNFGDGVRLLLDATESEYPGAEGVTASEKSALSLIAQLEAPPPAKYKSWDDAVQASVPTTAPFTRGGIVSGRQKLLERNLAYAADAILNRVVSSTTPNEDGTRVLDLNRWASESRRPFSIPGSDIMRLSADDVSGGATGEALRKILEAAPHSAPQAAAAGPFAVPVYRALQKGETLSQYPELIDALKQDVAAGRIRINPSSGRLESGAQGTETGPRVSAESLADVDAIQRIGNTQYDLRIPEDRREYVANLMPAGLSAANREQRAAQYVRLAARLEEAQVARVRFGQDTFGADSVDAGWSYDAVVKKLADQQRGAPAASGSADAAAQVQLALGQFGVGAASVSPKDMLKYALDLAKLAESQKRTELAELSIRSQIEDRRAARALRERDQSRLEADSESRRTVNTVKAQTTALEAGLSTPGIDEPVDAAAE